MTDCIFCKMVAGEITPSVVYENDLVLAFRDIHPQAPVHVLVIPKTHVPTLNELAEGPPELPKALLDAVREVAKIEGLTDSGYRTVINCRADAGQEIDHLHLHILGGRRMKWPPG
ncbi:MAG TPA: histidine triad nucleotide-binding protein [Methylococcus sp.]|nr:histidine triad nucleotide-binding protein [Methylococcus sp.]